MNTPTRTYAGLAVIAIALSAIGYDSAFGPLSQASNPAILTLITLIGPMVTTLGLISLVRSDTSDIAWSVVVAICGLGVTEVVAWAYIDALRPLDHLADWIDAVLIATGPIIATVLGGLALARQEYGRAAQDQPGEEC